MAGRRSHLLEFAVLGLLAEGPAHGYELRRQLTEVLGPFRALSYGTLYPALKSLLGRDLIRQDAASVTTPGRRPRIVYALTVSGREHFEELLTGVDEGAWEDEQFDVRVHFFARTQREVRLRILEGRLSRLQERARRASSRKGVARTGARLDAWSAALRERDAASLTHELRWLTTLIDAERRQLDAAGSGSDP